MAGLRYPKDMSTEWRKLQESVRRDFASANRRSLSSGVVEDEVSTGINPTNTSSYESFGGPEIQVSVGTSGVMFVMEALMVLQVGEGVAMVVYGEGPDSATYTSREFMVWPELTGDGLTGALHANLSRTIPETSLAPGEWTFEVRYKKVAGITHPYVAERRLTAIPL